MKRVLKWSIPIDGNRHMIGAGRVLHVACQSSPYTVEVWTEEDFEKTVPDMLEAQIYGTGQTYPDEGVAVGTFVYDPSLVWHVVIFPHPVEGGYIKR